MSWVIAWAVASASVPAAATTTSPAPVVNTAPGDALDRQMAANRAALRDARTRAADAERQSVVIGARARGVTNAADRDRLALAALALRIQSAEASLTASRARLAILNRLRTQQAADLATQQRPLMDLVAALQLLVRRPPLAIFAEPGTVSDLAHARALMDVIVPEVRRRTAVLQQRVTRSRRLADLQRLAANRLTDDQQLLRARRRELAQREASLRTRATSLDARAGLEGDRAIVLAEQAADVSQLLQRFERSGALRDRLARLNGPVPRPGSMAAAPARPAVARIAPAVATPAYRAPVLGDVISGMGAPLAAGRRARGLTIAAAAGAQIVAPADGRVAFSGPFRSYGQVVIIDHGDGWTSLITGMIATSVRVGGTLVQGSPIGRAGAGAPQITVELRRGGQPVDIGPLLY